MKDVLENNILKYWIDKVKDVQNTATMVGEEYYNVNGIKLTSPTSGIIIKLTRYSDGSTKATKFIN